MARRSHRGGHRHFALEGCIPRTSLPGNRHTSSGSGSVRHSSTEQGCGAELILKCYRSYVKNKVRVLFHRDQPTSRLVILCPLIPCSLSLIASVKGLRLACGGRAAARHVAGFFARHESNPSPVSCCCTCVNASRSYVLRRYLLNMGVSSTLTISIVCFGKLWGLVACHHCKPPFPGNWGT